MGVAMSLMGEMLQEVAFRQPKPYNSKRPKGMGDLVCLRRGGLVADILLRNRGQQDIGAVGIRCMHCIWVPPVCWNSTLGF